MDLVNIANIDKKAFLMEGFFIWFNFKNNYQKIRFISSI